MIKFAVWKAQKCIRFLLVFLFCVIANTSLAITKKEINILNNLSLNEYEAIMGAILTSGATPDDVDKLIHEVYGNAPKTDDKYLIKLFRACSSQ